MNLTQQELFAIVGELVLQHAAKDKELAKLQARVTELEKKEPEEKAA